MTPELKRVDRLLQASIDPDNKESDIAYISNSGDRLVLLGGEDAKDVHIYELRKIV